MSVRDIKAGRAYVELGTDDNRLVRGLRRAQAQLRAFGASVQAIGQRLMLATAAAAVPIAYATRTYADFADKMAGVRAVTGAGEEAFARLTKRAKELGATTSFTASQVAEGMQYLGMAGFNTEQILAGIPAVLDLAKAGVIDLGLAADIVSDVGSAFGMTADQIGRVADVMAITAASANTNIEMMGESLKYAAPLAAAAGQSLEETAAAIGVLGNNGIKASMAGTDLARIMKNLADSSAQKKLKAVGVATADADGNMRSLIDVMRDLGKASGRMSEQQRLAFFSDVFQRAAKSGLILADSADGLATLADRIKAANGAAADMAGIMDNTLGGSFRRLRSAVEAVQIAVGEALERALRAAADRLAVVAGYIKHVVDNHRELVVAIVKGIAVAGLFGASLFTLGLAAQAVAFAAGGLAAIVSGVIAVFNMMVAAITAILSPVGLVIAAVATLGVAIVAWTNIGAEALSWLMDRFGELRRFVTEVVNGMVDALKAGNLELAAEIVWLALKAIWQKGVHALNKVWVGAKRWFIQAAYDMWYGALTAAETVWHGLEVAWVGTVAFLSKAWTNFTSSLKSGWAVAENWLQKRFHELMGLFDQEYDVAGAQAVADQELQDKLSQIEVKQQQKLIEIEARRERRRDDARENHEGTLAELGRQWNDAEQQINADAAKELSKTEQALADAKSELNEAIEKARQAAQSTDGKGPAGMSIDDAIARAKAKFEQIFDGLGERVEERITVSGTFNPWAVRGLGPARTIDRIADATERTARNTGELADKQQVYE